MEELPTGTVTMLFSDIEGSTLLLRRLGDRYGEALSAHRALLRAAFGAHGGREMDTEGDSFFVVFRTARDAVSCCTVAQRSLASHEWPDGAPLRVRMGIHTGEPTPHEQGYVGMDVHRAARIAATAHGAQVVLSDTTRALVEEGLPAGVALRDLGWHRLKDIVAPEHIYQLVGAGLEEHFLPLKSLGAQTNVPVPPTPLVGREDAVGTICAAMQRPGTRLVTLTGAGGVGKSRLALAAAQSLAESFPHGIFFFPLAAVSDAEAMWRTISDGLGVSGHEPVATVTEYLSPRRALLVLDSLEQLHEASAVVAAVLSAAPQVAVLATSRRPLHLQGEQEQPVSPLEVPAASGAEEVAASAAVQLFVQHAALVSPGFAITEGNAGDVAAICRRLDGLPLAIELAASRVRLLGPKALLARLGQSLGLAGGEVGRPFRHQTLRATAAWSYDLLTPDLARVLEAVSVFAGGCDLDAIAAVALADEGLDADPLSPVAELLDASLITVAEGVDGEPRVGMLQMIREFARERLEQSGELDVTLRRHAEHFAGFAERMQKQLAGPRHMVALDRLEADHDNLRAALSWALEESAGAVADGERAGTGLQLVQAIAPFWYQHGHATEGRRWLERAVELASGEEGARLASIAHWCGVLLDQQGEYEPALRLFERSLAIWRELDNLEQVARDLNSLGITHRYLGHLDEARAAFGESIEISRGLPDTRRLAIALLNLGQTESAAGEPDRGRQMLEEALGLDSARDDMEGVALAKQSLAAASLRLGRPEEANDLLVSIHDYLVGSGDPEFLVSSLELFAGVAAGRGDAGRAARLAGAAEGIRQRAGMPIPPPDAQLFEQLLAPARATVRPEAWEAEIAAGAGLTQEQVVALVAPSSSRLKR